MNKKSHPYNLPSALSKGLSKIKANERKELEDHIVKSEYAQYQETVTPEDIKKLEQDLKECNRRIGNNIEGPHKEKLKAMAAQLAEVVANLRGF
jgi:hypothetical protein